MISKPESVETSRSRTRNSHTACALAPGVMVKVKQASVPPLPEPGQLEEELAPKVICPDWLA